MRKLKVGDVYEIFGEEGSLFQVVDIDNNFLISKPLTCNSLCADEPMHCYCEICWDTYNFIVNPNDWWE